PGRRSTSRRGATRKPCSPSAWPGKGSKLAGMSSARPVLVLAALAASCAPEPPPPAWNAPQPQPWGYGQYGQPGYVQPPPGQDPRPWGATPTPQAFNPHSTGFCADAGSCSDCTSRTGCHWCPYAHACVEQPACPQTSAPPVVISSPPGCANDPVELQKAEE